MHERAELLSSLLSFTKFFYKLRTGRSFDIDYPDGRRSHFLIIIEALEKLLLGDIKRLIINVPPRYGKSEMMIHFIAWSLALYPDSNSLYVSYSKTLAQRQTQTVRDIIMLPAFKHLFDVTLDDNSSAKGDFRTNKGGNIYAAGSGGTITGFGAGLKNTNRFGGLIAIDDIIKPDEATSDIIREGSVDWYYNTLQSRLNDPNTPIAYIGQRTHEDELVARLIQTGEWETIILPALDNAGNALYPRMHSKEQLLKMKEENPYVFAAQYQQDPQPAGGGVFKKEWFVLLDEEPEILATFLTIDTAETDKSYNDATVFSFWGLYRIKPNGIDIGMYGLHWLDCYELRVEPKDLQPEFMQFYADCMRHPVKPRLVAIERKSTGVTMSSILKDMQGINLLDIERTSVSGSKAKRYLEMQPIVAQKRISLPRDGKHTDICLEHMRKITANDSHRWDDVCFVAGTKIATLFGYKNIENIRENDWIITPFGVRKVTACGLTGYKKTINKFGLKGTKNHRIFNGRSFERLDTIYDDSNLSKLSLKELLRWQYKKLLHLTESNITLQGREDIILVAAKDITKGMLKDCMLRFMNFIVAKKFKKGMWFITKMATVSIMTLVIWNVFHVSNIWRIMQQKGKAENPHQKSLSIWKRLESKLKNGIEVMKVENGIHKMPKNIMKKLFTKDNVFARYVKSFLLPDVMLKPVAINVIPSFTAELLETSSVIVNYADQNSQQRDSILPVKTENSVQECAQEKAVYNLTVDRDHVYYANNILVSNCDTAYDAVKIALIDQIIPYSVDKPQKESQIMSALTRNFKQQQRLRSNAYGSR